MRYLWSALALAYVALFLTLGMLFIYSSQHSQTTCTNQKLQTVAQLTHACSTVVK